MSVSVGVWLARAHVDAVASFGEAQGLGKVVFKLNGLAVALSPIPYEEVSCFPDGHGVLAWLEDVCNNVHQESLQQVLVWFTQLRAEGNDEAWAISGGTWCVCVSMLVAAAQLLCLLQARAKGDNNELLRKIDMLGAITVEGLVRWCWERVKFEWDMGVWIVCFLDCMGHG